MIGSYVSQAKNRQKGNPRKGQFYTTEQADGGVFHVYDGGRRVFVPKSSGNLSGSTGPAAQSVASPSTRARAQVNIQDLLAALRADHPRKGRMRG